MSKFKFTLEDLDTMVLEALGVNKEQGKPNVIRELIARARLNKGKK